MACGAQDRGASTPRVHLGSNVRLGCVDGDVRKGDYHVEVGERAGELFEDGTVGC